MCTMGEVSNQAFEGVKFITIVKSFDIFGKFLTSHFLSSKMSCSRYLCQWSIKHARPFFGQQDIRNEKSAHVRDFEKKNKKIKFVC